MISFIKKLNENGYAGLVETLVGSVITLIVMAGTATAITTGLQATIKAQGHTKAVALIEKQFIKAKNLPYKGLGINIIGDENTNTQDLPGKDTVGCSQFSTDFENEKHVPIPNSTLDYCQIISSDSGVGTSYNVETHVTEIKGDSILKDLDSVFYDFDTGNFTAKRVTVIVSWFSGEFDVNKMPIMKTAQSEIVITPGLGDCVPADKATSSMECG